MKKLIALILIIALAFPLVFASEATSSESSMTEKERKEFVDKFGYEPYKKEEFPDWLHKVRRAEVIALGATALTFPIVNLSTQKVQFSENGTLDFLAKFGISAGAGLVIAIIDLVIGIIQEEAAAANE